MRRRRLRDWRRHRYAILRDRRCSDRFLDSRRRSNPEALLHSEPQQVELDLSYKERFYTGDAAVYSPDAYTRLLLDVLTGKQSAFVRDDELLASWKIWDPLLKQIEAKPSPLTVHTYPYGSRGPPEAAALIQKYGYQRNTRYSWKSGGNL